MVDGLAGRPLDSDLLRTFLAVADTGSFTAGAKRIFRTQSAASLQIKHLEDLIGQPVFERHGRGVRLSPAGERLESVARQVVGDLNRALASFAADPVEGRITIGVPDEFAHGVLSRVIADFAARHPATEVTVRCAASSGFEAALDCGELDLAVYDAQTVASNATLLSREPVNWVASRMDTSWQRDPLPVAMFDRDCWWRDAAREYLANAGIDYRVVYSSESSTGVLAALDAGIAVGLLAESALHDGLRILGAQDGFNIPAPESLLVMRTGTNSQDNTAVAAMEDVLKRAFLS